MAVPSLLCDADCFRQKNNEKAMQIYHFAMWWAIRDPMLPVRRSI